MDRLTGLRWIAAFYVFIFHVHLRQPLTFLPARINNVIGQGALGVNLFFVLSGFILAFNYHTKIEHSGAFYKTFMLKRLSRIYPVYLAGMAVLLIADFIFHSFPKGLGALIVANVLMVQSYIPPIAGKWYAGGGWSISTEFFFYLMLPLTLPLMLNWSKKKLIIALAILAILGSLPGCLFNLKVIKFDFSYAFPPFRFAEFMSGMAAALLVFRHKLVIRPVVCLIVLISGILYIMKFGYRLDGFAVHNIVVIPVIVVLLISLATSKSTRLFNWLGSNLMVYLGKISYSFYIFQIATSYVIDTLLERHIISPRDYFASILWLIVNLIISIAAYEFIEHPTHKYFNQKIRRANTEATEKTLQLK